MRKIALDTRALAEIPALGAVLGRATGGGSSAMPAAAMPSRWSGCRASCAMPARGRSTRRPLLHADTFHPTVKAWLFLTDVAEDAGPFTYVPGSHRLTAERLAWERRMSLAARQSANAEIRQGSFRIDPAELPSLGLPPPRAFAVPANTLVVADTFGFHARGPSLRPVAARRDLGLWPAQPVPAAAPRSSRGRPPRLGRRSTLSWKFGDVLERRRGQKKSLAGADGRFGLRSAVGVIHSKILSGLAPYPGQYLDVPGMAAQKSSR